MSLSTSYDLDPRLALRETSARSAPTNAGCAACASRDLCWPEGPAAHDRGWLKRLAFTRRKLKRGEGLYRMGDKFDCLYAIRSGFFKTRILLEDGRDQVTGFKMVGELLGFDGIGTDIYANDAIALEDSEVCVIPYRGVVQIANEAPAVAHQLHRIMSREIVREHGVMALLGTMQAEERVIAFLLNLSARFKARGYSASCFILRMTREEMGSYLGLKIETVSRVLTRLQGAGLIKVEHTKQVTLCNVPALRAVLGEGEPAEPSATATRAVQRTRMTVVRKADAGLSKRASSVQLQL